MLAEACGRDLACTGFDINPAAFLFTAMHRFATLTTSERARDLAQVAHALAPYQFGGLFQSDPQLDTGGVIDAISSLQGLPLLAAAVAIMIASGDLPVPKPAKLARALAAVHDAVGHMPRTEAPVRAAALDARYMDLPDSSVDLIITSPPYINVFNYHQNYRPTLERLGWDPLASAAAEIGANRKHRQNRFRTVVQYAIDMALSLAEIRRVLVPGGVAVLIVGRCSTVRGVSFANAIMIALIARMGPGMTLELWRERRFVNRYGQTIYEDVLTFNSKKPNGPSDIGDAGRAVGV